MNGPPEPPPKIPESPTRDASYFRGLTCPNCGEPNEQSARFCRKCGWNLRRISNGPSVALVLLFVFLGIPGLCLGGCMTFLSASTLMSSSETNRREFPFSVVFLLLGLVGLTTFGLTLYFAFLRKRK